MEHLLFKLDTIKYIYCPARFEKIGAFYFKRYFHFNKF